MQKKTSERKCIKIGKTKRILAAFLSVMIIFSIFFTDSQLILAEGISSSTTDITEESSEAAQQTQEESTLPATEEASENGIGEEETGESSEVSQQIPEESLPATEEASENSIGEEETEESSEISQQTQEEPALSAAEEVSENAIGKEELDGLSAVQKSGEEEQITISNLDMQTEELEGSAIIGATDQVSFNITASLSGPSSQSVWLGYRFTLPEKSPSGGTWGFGTGSYSWLGSMGEEDKMPTVQKINGNLVIEGKVNAQANEGNLIPGIYMKSITVTSSNMANNEAANLEVECWVLDNEDTKKEASVQITISQTCEYRIYCDKISNSAVVSGYFNQDTGEFTLRKPSDMTGYQYGRVYGFEPYVSNPYTTERLDKNKPLSLDIKYQVLKKEGGQYVPEDEEEYQPVLMVTKKHNKDCKNELPGSPIEDVTLGNLIYDSSNSGTQEKGEYSYEMEDGVLHVSAANRNYDTKDTIRLYCLVFVPVK